MKTNLLFDFSVNKEDNTISVKREFAANLSLVWDAWTKAELLNQWWAPKPYHVETKSMDFREGGKWFYAMVSPEGEKHWCKMDYEKIEPSQSFSGLDAFCDENENESKDMPRMHWTNVFTEQSENTLVDITLKYESTEDLEKILELGFKEGFTMGLSNLDELLLTLKNK